jgi:RimJ/RimL family protein N-acetyltransferase
MSLAKTYRIETDRLVVRCYQPNDAPLLHEAIKVSIEHLLPWMPWAKQEPGSVDERLEKIRQFRGEFDLGLDYTFGVFNKDETELVGSTGLHTRLGGNAREIGYWISASHINQGYAKETVSALTKVGFEVEGLDRLEIRCDPANERSLNIPKKLGYHYEATLKKRLAGSDGNPRDVMIWSMFKADYQKSVIREMKLKAFDVGGRILVI